MDIRNFSKVGAVMDIPDLTSIQKDSYRDFLQSDVPPDRREDVGLQRILNEVFPIINEAKRIRLDLVCYRLGKPRYMPDQCLQLRLTYGRPFYVRVRLTKEDEVIEEDVYLGEMPIMLGGGEFIINGAERVIVTQLHRSPGGKLAGDGGEPAGLADLPARSERQDPRHARAARPEP
jgi:DNA-directed RNA polymerase subunit beta